MSLSPSVASGKPILPNRYKPTQQEGQYIRYRLRLAGRKLVDISRKLELHDSSTRKVILGQRRSSRIESEIARILGKASWNDVVLEARSEVQKKPVKVILQEMKQESKKALNEGMQKNAHNAIYNKDWSAHLKAFEEEQAAKLKRRGA